MSDERENQKQELEKRDIELENLVGNLMIAEYQVEKLRCRVTEKVGRYRYGVDKKVSPHIFKYDSKWFKISVKVEELTNRRRLIKK